MVGLQRDIFQGLVLLRILHAASLDPVSGVELSAQFDAVGHRVSPGTLYPLLHRMEKAGWLKSAGKTVKGKHRRYYRITKKGRGSLQDARPKLLAFVAGIVGPPTEPDGVEVRVVDVEHLQVLTRGDDTAVVKKRRVRQRAAASIPMTDSTGYPDPASGVVL